MARTTSGARRRQASGTVKPRTTRPSTQRGTLTGLERRLELGGEQQRPGEQDVEEAAGRTASPSSSSAHATAGRRAWASAARPIVQQADIRRAADGANRRHGR